MKEGWDYKKLGEVGTFVRGGNFSKTDFVENGFPCIHYGQIHMKFGIETFKHISCVPPEMVKPERCAKKGDLVIAITSEDDAGSCKCTAWMGNYDAYVGGHTAIYRHTMQPKFVSYYFLSPNFQKDKLEFTHGFKVVEINPKDIAKITIPVPPLSEQQSIVDYLDSAFAKIDAMKANAEKALDEAKALFQASLKKMLEPKEGWEEKKLGDICNDIRYGTSTPSHEDGDYKYLRMNNITNDGFLDISHYKTISLPPKELEKCIVKKGDILFNRTNSRELVGKSCVFTEEEKMVIAGYLIRIRLKDGFEPQFITYSMNLQQSLGLFQHLIVGAVHQANISANNIQKVIINYPTLSEQQAIVATLDSLKSKVDKLQANFDKISQECDALKQAILRQVFE